MQVPVRLVLLLRPQVSPGVMLATAFSTIVFTATPFLIPLVADEYDVGLAFASLVGTTQLAGFVVGSWGSGRFLRPRRRVFVAAMVVAVAANLLASPVPPLYLLLLLRFVSGVSLGLISWFGWVQVFGDERRMGDIATIGPVVGIVSAPLVALVAVRGGMAEVFLFLGLLAVAPLIFNRGSGATEQVPERTERSRAVPAARVMLLLLGLFTTGGSAVFQFAVVIADRELGLTAATVAIAFSLNAVVGVPAARYSGPRPWPGVWMMGTAGCAFLVGLVNVAPVFFVAVIMWGFFFWMGIPGVFKVLADRSVNPEDRAGDAQAVMATGRVIGPFVGGALLDTGGAATLGLAGGTMMLAAGVGVFAVRVLIPPQ
ncbi:MAG: MFS transporter [Actinomycetia bacterium]|nr:MFS transporter [Actinomycetes bacterium]MCP4084508.1 MFS transporter [Actinomycetes bacterium]